MKSALLSTGTAAASPKAPLRYNQEGLDRVQKAASAVNAYADAEEKEEGEESKRFSALMDMIADACSKMDEGSKRMDARMDSFEEKLTKAEADRADSAKNDEETEAEKKAKADAEGETEEEKTKREAEEKAKADADEMAADKARKDAEDKEKTEKEEKEKAEADSVTSTRAELAELRGQIATLNARAPQIISDSDRERFASIQEKAEPVFQTFGDRAPAPLEGETPTQYKRRLGGKMQSHSTKWKDARLSAIGDDNALDVVLDQIYADAISIGKRGADVAKGHLRAIKTVTEAGHIRIEHIGDPSVMTAMFSGNMQRA